MESNIKIEKYQEGDYEKYLQDIEKRNMKEFVDKYEGGWKDEVEKDNFYRLLKEGHAHKIIYGNGVAGFFVFIKIENEEVLFIKDFQIKKEFQGRGIGSKVLNFLEEKAKENECNSIELSVFKDNPALEFYKNKGFSQSKLRAKNKNSLILEKQITNSF